MLSVICSCRWLPPGQPRSNPVRATNNSAGRNGFKSMDAQEQFRMISAQIPAGLRSRREKSLAKLRQVDPNGDRKCLRRNYTLWWWDFVPACRPKRSHNLDRCDAEWLRLVFSSCRARGGRPDPDSAWRKRKLARHNTDKKAAVTLDEPWP